MTHEQETMLQLILIKMIAMNQKINNDLNSKRLGSLK